MSKVNVEKYKNVILYFFANCNNSHLGKTKLNKLLYYLDFISYRDNGVSVTGDTYIHEDYGPIPVTVDEILASLKKEKKIEVDFDASYKRSGKYTFRNKANFNPKIYNTYEKTLLKKISKFFYPWSTDKIITQTHLEAPWFYSKIYDIVDFAYSKDIDIF